MATSELKYCPECGCELKRSEGCVSCPQCGWGLCSQVMKKQDKKLQDKKLFLIRKHVLAFSVEDAIKKEKTTPVSDIILDEDYEQEEKVNKREMGFKKNK